MKYGIMLADPPWKQMKGGKKSVRPNSSGEQLDYTTLTLEEIEQILQQFQGVCQENHVLFLWTIDKYLHDAEIIAKNLGYKLHARMVWNKVTGIPAAFTIRYGHEYLLYLYKGKLLPVDFAARGKIHSVFTEQVTRHSKKPEISYKIIEYLYPNIPKIELFARNPREKWDVWGDEVETSENLEKSREIWDKN